MQQDSQGTSRCDHGALLPALVSALGQPHGSAAQIAVDFPRTEHMMDTLHLELSSTDLLMCLWGTLRP
jgi:hypothetical protein